VIAEPVAESVEVSSDLQSQQEQYTAGMTRYALTVAAAAAQMDGNEALLKSDKVKRADEVPRRALNLETEKPSQVIQIGLLCGASGPMPLRHRRA
jgi:hypothetical protein